MIFFKKSVIATWNFRPRRNLCPNLNKKQIHTVQIYFLGFKFYSKNSHVSSQQLFTIFLE